MNTTIDILPEDYAGLEGENEIMRELYAVKYALARVSGYDIGRLCKQASEDVEELRRKGYPVKYRLPLPTIAPTKAVTPPHRNIRRTPLVVPAGLGRTAVRPSKKRGAVLV
jgi:hypothetical protein